jgi:hypothetical protein
VDWHGNSVRFRGNVSQTIQLNQSDPGLASGEALKGGICCD